MILKKATILIVDDDPLLLLLAVNLYTWLFLFRSLYMRLLK
jgi:hypothetical protein